MIKYLETNNFKEKIKEGVILVDFYAEWCGPCKMLAEILEKLENVNILKVNVDSYPDIAVEYGVMSIPTLILFKDGKIIDKSIGFKDEDAIKEMLAKAK